MMHDLAALLPHWGPWLVAVSAFLSCMMVPLPTSPLLLTAGALSGTGHLWLPELAAGATLGATAGDLAAFALARRIGPWLNRPGSRRAALFAKAQELIVRRGTMAVFLSRWLVTPLGPATNYVAGAAGMPLHRFALATLPGEGLWAAIHLLAGHLLARGFRHTEGAALKALAVGAGLTVVLLVLRRIWRRRHGLTI
ncbi:DedA family protein [Paracoccus benzoatiresistens]|uniref:VTT domain-containing protein n=1 Tax=Paracoccus benzoatiresistens TaxID=2997341 RepID=A0ABT4J755_9RHOB|nr:VTT domain-containing protein [Paracoccus sp. EF6]MCZ0962961.1 VTT domain-containing protein [Paracoccus sp. EF6]